MQKIRTFTAVVSDAFSFYADEKKFDATLMNFVVIGESARRLSDSLKDSHPQIPWRKIAGFRNIIAHDYFGIDADEVWDIIQNHLPLFETDLRDLLP